jgi:putative transcriptional regulator
MKSLAGHFLVGSPHLADPNFFRSVVLMVQHDEEGALGLILNRPTDNSVADIWEQVCDESSDCRRPIFLGGPVTGPLMAIHSQLAYSELQVVPGVHFSTQRHNIIEIVAGEPKPFLLFSGYSGWGGGQLERELKVGGWLTVAASDDDVFYEGEDLWERLIQQIGQEIIAPAIGRKMTPPDPSCN